MPDLPIVLASASPRRQELMRQMGLSFRVVPSTVSECMDPGADPRPLACSLAGQKAEDIAARLNEPSLVIGADTIVYKDRVLGKPEDEEDAVRMLLSLQGGEHEVITGLALVDAVNGYRDTAWECTCVEMAPLTEEQIRWYVNSGEAFDKAGAYGIQGLASLFIPRIRGCYFNVVGLPVHRLWIMLQRYAEFRQAALLPLKPPGYQNQQDWQ